MKTGINLLDSALRSDGKLKTDILEHSTKENFCFNRKIQQCVVLVGTHRHGSGKCEIVSERVFGWRLCTHLWKTFQVSTILNLSDFVVDCCVNGWDPQREFV